MLSVYVTKLCISISSFCDHILCCNIITDHQMWFVNRHQLKIQTHSVGIMLSPSSCICIHILQKINVWALFYYDHSKITKIQSSKVLPTPIWIAVTALILCCQFQACQCTNAWMLERGNGQRKSWIFRNGWYNSLHRN